jgi:peroxiredoxin/predicted 2-oxoglutarate/Fe(II)-dependent dioxygenase YbiX
MPNVIQVGTPAPWFVARSPANPTFQIHTAAGRFVVLCFFGSAGDPAGRRVLDDLLRHRDVFNGETAYAFGVSTDPEDESTGRVKEVLPGFRLFWDFDRNLGRQFGAYDPAAAPGSGDRRMSVVLDERLRVAAVLPFDDQPDQHVPRLLAALAALPALEPARPAAVQAPVLVVPRIFEPDLCRTLIRYYEERGGQESGFMRDVGGKTVAMHDASHKRRRDEDIQDESLRRTCMVRIHDRLLPEIYKAFQFRATRMERYIVACYDGTSGGFFRAHRDNTTKGTAHRRFAVSLNLNTGEYDGGDLRFPEFGRLTYRPPAGGAVVFSCSLLHEATPVTRGRRYVFLPFLYDEAAAKVREENQQFLAGSTAPEAAPVAAGP